METVQSFNNPRSFSTEKEKIFFLGIGGISMSSLAAMAHANGETVGGSDVCPSPLTRELEEMGIPVSYDDTAQDVCRYDRVVYTFAADKDDLRLQNAKAHKIPLESRAAYLGRKMLSFSHRIGIAGTHGKSTVTAMLSKIYLCAKKDPNILCGALLPFLEDRAYRIAAPHSDILIFEACEYRDAFLSFAPTVAVLLNADWDHVDYFPSPLAIADSMRRFASLAKKSVYFADDPAFAAQAPCALEQSISFSLCGKGDYTVSHVKEGAYHTEFTLICRESVLGHVYLPLGGHHHLVDALAACAAAHSEGIPFAAIAAGLADFHGAKRRMEYLGVYCGAQVYSDYAHHPTELQASLALGRQIANERGGRLFCVFQSHTYSRSAAFCRDFSAALGQADRYFVLPIYAAREQNTFGVHASDLCKEENGCFVAQEKQLPLYLQGELSDKDILLFCGAGSIDGIARSFVS